MIGDTAMDQVFLPGTIRDCLKDLMKSRKPAVIYECGQAVKKEVGNDLSASRELTSQAVKKFMQS